jgi:hypothetical protein
LPVTAPYSAVKHAGVEFVVYGEPVASGISEGEYPALIFINDNYYCAGMIEVKRINGILRPVISRLQLSLSGVPVPEKEVGLTSVNINSIYPGSHFSISKFLISVYFTIPDVNRLKTFTCRDMKPSAFDSESFFM